MVVPSRNWTAVRAHTSQHVGVWAVLQCDLHFFRLSNRNSFQSQMDLECNSLFLSCSGPFQQLALNCLQSHAVTYLVQAQCYKPEVRGFDSRWGRLIFFNLSNPSSRTLALGSTEPLQKCVPDFFLAVKGLTSPPSVSRVCRVRASTVSSPPAVCLADRVGPVLSSRFC
jgi:hypothetical protein